MNSLTVGDCRVDFLPIVQGLTSEADTVRKHYGSYEAYGIPLGVEALEALRRRADIIDDYEVGELDLVYANRLSLFGEVQMPCPAYCELVDLCDREKKGLIPLDMNDDAFTSVFIENVKSVEFVNEHRIAKKGMKRKFDTSSPEAFAKSWDSYINNVKGYRRVAECREKYIAGQIANATGYRKSLLVVVEAERMDGILRHLEVRT